MATLLIVDDDTALLGALTREMAAENFEVLQAHDFNEAVVQLTAQRVDVLVTDLRMNGRDGLDLLRTAQQVAADTRMILMSAYATARDHQLATELGAVKVLCKPFAPHALLEAIREALDTREGFRGSLHGLSLTDLLQVFHHGQRSISIAITGSTPGAIHLRDGQVIHASYGNVTGEEAFRVLLNRSSGAIRTNRLGDVEATIQKSFSALLLDSLRVNDEEEHHASVDDEEFSSGELMQLAVSEDEATDKAGGATTVVEPGADVSIKERGTMGRVDDACKKVVEEVEGAVAAGVVDLETGMLLGIYNSANYTQTLNEVVAAATMDMFRGPNVSRIEKMVRQHRGLPDSGDHYFQEVHITSAHNFHFAKTLKGGKAVIMMVTKKSTNIGMGWAMLKSVIPEVEPAVP